MRAAEPSWVSTNKHRLTVAEYMTMQSDDRTELLQGDVYDVSPRNEPHRYAVSKLVQVLVRQVDPSLIVRSQDAVAIDGWEGRDAPEVDVAVLHDAYYDMVPTAADAVALIEVSDSSYQLDRDYKMPLYVAAGVPSWLVNVRKRQVEAYLGAADLERPEGTVFGMGDISIVAGVKIGVAGLFAPQAE